jgi:hypothetical protein
VSVLAVTVAETGFALPSEPSEPAWSNDRKWRLLYVPGVVVEPLQYFRVSLVDSQNNSPRDVLIVNARSVPPSNAVAASVTALRSHFSGHVVAVLQDSREGWVSAASDDEHQEHAAAALSAVQVCCAWDESPVIVVHFGAERFEVAMVFHKPQWFARVERAESRSK